MNKKELTPEPEQRIFITNTMRSGSSQVISALSVHSKIMILSDNIHFFRFMYKRYEPLSEKNVYKLLLHQNVRLQYRVGLNMDVENILKNIKEKGFTYDVIYNEIMTSYLKQINKTIWGEAPALQWREIPDFLKFFPNGKVIHIYRDPRGVLSSWKKLSSLPDNVYLNAIFNWIDSINYMKRYKEILSTTNYLPIKFENVAGNPEFWIKKICDFIGIEFEEIMIQGEKWKDVIGNDLSKLPQSANEGKNVVGFSIQRTQNWRKNMEEWDIALVEFLVKDKLEELGYESFKKDYSISTLRKGIEMIKNNPFLLKQYNVYLATGEGTNKYPTDPTDPKSWGAPHNLSEWFLDSPVAKDYFHEIDNIKRIVVQRYNS